jgi:hypothetical protein
MCRIIHNHISGLDVEGAPLNQLVEFSSKNITCSIELYYQLKMWKNRTIFLAIFARDIIKDIVAS